MLLVGNCIGRLGWQARVQHSLSLSTNNSVSRYIFATLLYLAAFCVLRRKFWSPATKFRGTVRRTAWALARRRCPPRPRPARPSGLRFLPPPPPPPCPWARPTSGSRCSSTPSRGGCLSSRHTGVER